MRLGLYAQEFVLLAYRGGQNHSGDDLFNSARTQTQLSGIFDSISKVLRGSVCDYEETLQALIQQGSRYQSIDDTIVQLFISQSSVLMSRVDRIQSESSQPIGEET